MWIFIHFSLENIVLLLTVTIVYWLQLWMESKQTLKMQVCDVLKSDTACCL